MSDFNQANNPNAPRKPIPKTAFDDLRLRLTGPLQEGGLRPSSFRVSVVRNNPRFDVFTNIQNDVDGGRIPAPMDAWTFYALMEELKKIIEGPADEQVKVDNRTGPPGQQQLLSTTMVGKDKEGRVFISVIAENRPRIKFTFLPSDWHAFYHKDGTVYGEAELSVLYASGWVVMVQNLVANVLDTHYEPNQWQLNQMAQQAAASEGASGGGGQDAYQASAEFDKELPF